MTRWLSEAEHGSWRAWLAMVHVLPTALDRDLRESLDLTLPDYEVMVALSEAPQRRVRMADLAEATYGSRSRTTHQITRMEQAGWVTRQKCEEDARGQWAILTDEGWDLLVRAAPIHVESVRKHLLDVLGTEDFAALGDICQRVLAALDQSPWPVAPAGSSEE